MNSQLWRKLYTFGSNVQLYDISTTTIIDESLYFYFYFYLNVFLGNNLAGDLAGVCTYHDLVTSISLPLGSAFRVRTGLMT